MNAVARRVLLFVALALAPLALAVVAFALYVVAGVRAGAASPTGTIAGLGVSAPVHVVRDARGIPHVRAANERDLFFTEGYLQGVDRLFQLDLYRRAVEGRLSEVFGGSTVAIDEAARVYDVRAIARDQLALMPASERANLAAFADGVNAAMRTRPLPPEFRVLAYRPEPWTPEDSLLSSFSTVIALTDTWDDVAARVDVARAVGPAAKDAFFSITDPRYDAPTTGAKRASVAPLPALPSLPYPNATPVARLAFDTRAGAGSNDFAAGASLTTTHRALLANDPHLELRIPGVWWLADLAAPGYHAAGATFPGVPGIVLGHNEHLAWGATNGTVATVRIYRETFAAAGSDAYYAMPGPRLLHAAHRSETILVRFGRPVVRDYLRTRHGFVFRDDGAVKYAAAWTADLDRHSSFEQFDGLDRAASAPAAYDVLARYPGPPQNFVLADDLGAAAYVLAGEIPLDDAWGLAAHDGAHEGAPVAHDVPYRTLPHVVASRSARVFTANDRTYAAGYPYRLTAAFSPPYRAASIAAGLAHPPYGVATFAAIQADVASPIERELARRTAAALASQTDPALRGARDELLAFDGRFVASSHAAVTVNAIRRAGTEMLARMHMPPEVATQYLARDGGCAFVALMRALRDRPRGWVPRDDYDAFLVTVTRAALADVARRGPAGSTWADAGARTARHPLSLLGITAFDGVRFPGNGDAYSPHVQAPANAQSFRAVWDVGNWKAGGMVIPLGESGEPGSAHYRDLAPAWLAGTLVPLPFDDDAVRADTKETLDLTP